ncbi:MAG: ferredoxin [Spirochaetia bacterium]|nr:ferredoxin [Spirochaetia bacterium]
MKIECTIDKISQTMYVNSNKPLNLILSEDATVNKFNSNCDGNFCGNCIVMLDDKAVLSCLIPAFRIKGKNITTYEGFKKTRYWHDIERAYDDTHLQPCSRCYASKTLILESLLKQIVKTEDVRKHGVDEETIVREMRLNTCACLDAQEMVTIFQAAANYRRKRRVRGN